MELKEYQVGATSTAEPRAYDLQYLVPGLVGELGELFGQRAKGHWHGWTEEKLLGELTLEYGDIAWLTAVLLKRLDVDTVDMSQAEDARHTAWMGQSSPWQQIMGMVSGIHLLWVEGYGDNHLVQQASLLWAALQAHSLTITGNSFDVVLQVNLDKLASRAARNVLQGAGDHR